MPTPGTTPRTSSSAFALTTQVQAVLYAPIHSATIRQARRHAAHAIRILDIGCGGGRLLRTTRSYYPNAVLVGLDPSAGMLTAATHGPGSRITRVQAAAEQLPFAAESFGLVFAVMSARHWNDPQAGVAEVSRVLIPHGTCILADTAKQPPPPPRWWPRRSPQPNLARLLIAHGMTLLHHETIPAQRSVPDVHILTAQRPTGRTRTAPG